MKRSLLLLAALVACNAEPTPYAQTIGRLEPGTTLAVRSGDGAITAYRPAIGEPRDQYTIAATARSAESPPPNPQTRPVHGGIRVVTPAELRTLLVRVPDGVTLDVDAKSGDVSVTDIHGNARIRTGKGDVRVLVPGYVQAQSGMGNVSVTMGATQWPGTLEFSAPNGDVEVWVSENARFTAHLSVTEGTIFTDFGLRGNAHGLSERINGTVNGGTERAIDIHVGKGNIRLLRLHPQA